MIQLATRTSGGVIHATGIKLQDKTQSHDMQVRQTMISMQKQVSPLDESLCSYTCVHVEDITVIQDKTKHQSTHLNCN